MAFWIYIDVAEDGQVSAQTYTEKSAYFNMGAKLLRIRRGNTVSQALRSLAAAMVTAKAETVNERKTA